MIKVSLLVPVFNHEIYIRHLFESIASQNYDQLQIVAVDDGSTDNSYNVLLECQALSRFETIVLKKKNGGICSALNLALKSSTGQLIAFMASDDLLLPNRFLNQVELFLRSPNLKVLYNNGRYYLNGRQCGKVHSYAMRYLLKGPGSVYDYVTTEVPALFIQSMLIKRDFLIDIGAFDEDTNSDDWSLNIRIFSSLEAESEFAFEDVDVFLYRTHTGQFHRNPVQMSGLVQKVINKYFTPLQLARFKLKHEITNCIRAVLTLDINNLLPAIRAANNISKQLNYTGFEYFVEFIYCIKKSILLKKNKILSGGG